MTSNDISTSLSSLEAFPTVLKQQIQPLSDGALRYKPAGEWSAIENVGHLIDVEALWMGRIRQMLAAEKPALAAPDVDELVRRQNYQHKDPANLLHTFSEMRAETVAFLRTLKPLHLERRGIHPTRGEVSVADVFRILAGHDVLHTNQIAKTVAEAPAQ